MLLARCNRDASNFSVEKSTPRTNKELDDIRNGALSGTEEINLQKWAGVFDDDGLNFMDLRSETPEPTQPPPPVQERSFCELDELPEPPNTRTRVAGKPIDLDTAKALRNIILGNASYTFTRDWRTFHFKFRECRSSIPYGLQADSPGPKVLALSVQAYVLKQLLFLNPEEEERQFGRKPPTPSAGEQEKALIDALTDILWKVASPVNSGNKVLSDKRKVIVALPCFDACFRTPGFFLADGVTERLWLFALYNKQDLNVFMRRNLHFFCDRRYQGAILLVYSVVLSHTIDMVRSDLAKCQEALLTETARPTQAFINLLLTGTANCYIHNGVICYDKHGRLLDIPKPGPKQRSEMGFLFFNKAENDKTRTLVGCMLRTPHLPIWITQVNGTYGLLFCTSRDLVADWKIERFFTIHYYNGHFSQTQNTNISIDTRRRAVMDPDREISIWDDEEEKERKQPSLERLLNTKWPDATLDWNGETPYY